MHTLRYFIKKFVQIPMNQWGVGAFEDPFGKRCAIGHCFSDRGTTHESVSLTCLEPNIACINDNFARAQICPEPKLRVLRHLIFRQIIEDLAKGKVEEKESGNKARFGQLTALELNA